MVDQRGLAANASATCCSESTTAEVIGTAAACESLAACTMTVTGSPVPWDQTLAQLGPWLAAHAWAWASSFRCSPIVATLPGPASAAREAAAVYRHQASGAIAGAP